MDSWVLITGGATRLGRETGLAFAKAGWNVICHYRNSQELAKAFCQEALKLQVQAQCIQAELESEEDCSKFFETAISLSDGRLSCIVNNASLFNSDRANNFQEVEALAQLKVNLMAPMRLGKWFHQYLFLQKPPLAADPSIVHILDQKVFNLNPDYYSYTISKLALERLVALQAQSFAPLIRVNAVAPGLLYPSGPQNLENFNKASQANLLRRAIEPEKVAQSVLFLANNSCITGTSIKVDNGQHLVPSEKDIMFVVDEFLNKTL
jgi:NAD(P)-dependent dehydrogenase (short-subunit alcohol dehydrogenase family)